MGIGDTFSKVKGLFVESDQAGTEAPSGSGQSEAEKMLAELAQQAQQRRQPSGKPKTVEQVVREAPGPNLEDVKVPTPTPSQVLRPDGTLDCQALYSQAALPAAQFTAEQMLDMLDSLPSEVPLDTKRQMVKVSLDAMGKAIGATPETIVTDASRKLAALADYTDQVASQTVEFITKSELEIAGLQAQIEEKRKAIESAKQKQEQTAKMCEAEADRLDDVLEFFSLDVPPSKYAGQAKK